MMMQFQPHPISPDGMDIPHDIDDSPIGHDTTMGHHLSLEQEQDEELQLQQQQIDQMIQLADLTDVLVVLKSQEALYHPNGGLHPHLHDSWRPVMVSWMFSVIDTFNLMPHLVTTAIYYLDACGPTMPKEDYPLLAMTALNVAVKCHETKMFPLDQLVQLMGGNNSGGGKQQQEPQPYMYTPDDIIEMERTILRVSGWKLHPPTAHEFLHQFLEVLPNEVQRAAVLEQASANLKNGYMWEHVLHQQQHPQPMSFPTSTLAYASMLLAFEDTNVPLPDKQRACQLLLEVADISAYTPRLSEAYNWLAFSKSLQEQLMINQSKQIMALPSTSVAAASTAPTTQSSPPAVVEFEEHELDGTLPCDSENHRPDLINGPAGDTEDLEQAPLIDLENDSEDAANDTIQYCPLDLLSTDMLPQQSSLDDDEDGEDVCTTSEVIFFTQTRSGDGFEIVSDSEESMMYLNSHDEDDWEQPEDCDEDDDKYPNDGGRHTNWVDEAILVLTESLDDDGFEVSYANDWNQHINKTMSEDLMSSLVASPRMVTL